MKNFQNKLAEKIDTQHGNHVPSVEAYMTRDLITFKKDTKINVVINSLLDNRISGAPVLNDQGRLIGLVDDKDCLNVLFNNVYNRLPTSPSEEDTVSNYMSNVMKSIHVDQSILDAASMFVSSSFKRLIVLDDDDKLVGQVSRRDILRAIRELS